MAPIDITTAIVSTPLRLPPEALLREAISSMSHTRGQCATGQSDSQVTQVHLDARASCVLVMAGDRLLGIVTERDVVRLSLEFPDFGDQPLASVMTPAVVTLHTSDLEDMFYALQLMRQHRIRHLPVLDDQDQVMGLITHESLRQVIRPTDLLRMQLVSEVMTTQVVTAQPGDWVRSVAATIADHQVSSVMVVEPLAQESGGYRPVGILTERDLLQFYALGLEADQHQVGTVMSAPVFTVSPEDSLWRVQQLMATHHITRLAVTGTWGELLGIVTQTSLLQGLSPLEIYKLAETLEARVHRLEAEKVALLEERNAELERQVAQRTQALQAQAERERLLRDLATRIRTSLSLPDILATTVQEVRQLLGCDRVTILQFDEHWHSTVVAESTDSAKSLLGERIEDCCFQAQQAERYRQGHIRVVPDIYTTEMSDCHREMLIRLQTRAKILVPLLCGENLWGLLNVNESDRPRQWTEAEVALLQSLGVQLAIALTQATQHQKIQTELQERQRAEAALQTTFQQLEAAQRIARVGSWELDHRSQTLHWSTEVFRIFEIDPRQFAASYEGFLNAIHPEDVAMVSRTYDRHLADKQPYSITHRLLMADGRIKYVQEECETRYDDNEQPLVSLGTVQDITVLKQAELALEQLNTDLEARVTQRTLALQEREAQLRDLFDNANDLIQSVYLVDGRFEYVNRAWCSTLGYSEAEIAHLTIFDVLHPDCQEHCHKAIAQMQAGHMDVLEGVELTFISKTQQAIVVEGNLNCRYEQGRPVATRAIFRDITERKQYEATLEQTNQELRRATRLKDEFLANMSHELRTPLNAILGMAEVLQEQVFGPITAKQHKCLATIERSGQHLLALINDILDVAKIESGQVEMDIAPIPVASLCNASLTFVKQQALKKRLQLVTQFPPQGITVDGDERRLRQVLINLLNNAVKFTPDGGTITLAVTDLTTATPPVLQIAIQDTGIGIRAEDQAKLFQPFIQVDSALNRKYEGTGLGLVLAKRIVELHGGHIDLTSTVGVGSCFTLTLPAHPAQSSPVDAAALPPDAPAVPVAGQPLILLAEDNLASIETTTAYLEAKGYRLQVAHNGYEVLTAVAAEIPDLILMDIQMPDMDGLTAIQHLRQQPALLSVPIIALTALAMADDRDRCLAAGANEYLSKPIRMKMLHDTIQTWLQGAAVATEFSAGGDRC